MKQKKRKQSSFAAPLAGEQKIWLFLAIFSIGGQRSLHYRPLHWNLPADGRHLQSYLHAGTCCTYRGNDCSGGNFAVCPVWLFRRSSHKGAYGALFKVRCMVAEHMARAPLGALNERRTGT